ncbi:LysR family transcriptional regulator [uncultured Piscinibacter sp.]|uniref:LysR family transcriptional regulator n=1 Tax=uncultured Piscinibacter sp. TaxID=1131835 RepID=UPI00261CDDB5|nr:LysR family transcriptional regulator [uncultured Piscinibacter sp.]
MINPVTLRHLRYFVAVAEELHFGRAAERLHISQPPLSRQIAELEAALGVTLLVRGPRQVRLSPAGERALAEFRSLLASTQAALQRVASLGDGLPRLRVGLLGWLNLNKMSALDQQLRRRGLVASVESELMASHEALAALSAGRLDAALVAAPLQQAGADAVAVARLRMAAVVPAGSDLARRRSLSLAELNDVPPFYRFRRSANRALWDHLQRQYREHGFVPRQEAPAADVIAVLARIGAGAGCTLVPEPLAVRHYAGVARRALKERVTVDLALLTRADLDPALRAALQAGVKALLPPGAEALGSRPPPVR